MNIEDQLYYAKQRAELIDKEMAELVKGGLLDKEGNETDNYWKYKLLENKKMEANKQIQDMNVKIKPEDLVIEKRKQNDKNIEKNQTQKEKTVKKERIIDPLERVEEQLYYAKQRMSMLEDERKELISKGLLDENGKEKFEFWQCKRLEIKKEEIKKQIGKMNLQRQNIISNNLDINKKEIRDEEIKQKYSKEDVDISYLFDEKLKENKDIAIPPEIDNKESAPVVEEPNPIVTESTPVVNESNLGENNQQGQNEETNKEQVKKEEEKQKAENEKSKSEKVKDEKDKEKSYKDYVIEHIPDHMKGWTMNNDALLAIERQSNAGVGLTKTEAIKKEEKKGLFAKIGSFFKKPSVATEKAGENLKPIKQKQEKEGLFSKIKDNINVKKEEKISKQYENMLVDINKADNILKPKGSKEEEINSRVAAQYNVKAGTIEKARVDLENKKDDLQEEFENVLKGINDRKDGNLGNVEYLAKAFGVSENLAETLKKELMDGKHYFDEEGNVTKKPVEVEAATPEVAPEEPEA